MSFHANQSQAVLPVSASDLSTIVSAPPKPRYRFSLAKLSAIAAGGFLWVLIGKGVVWALHALHVLK